MTSFRAIAQNIDLLYPAQGLRDLASRFRYPDITPGRIPPGPISFRDLARRIEGKDVKRIEFIHYNTYLLRANFKLLDLMKSGIGIGRVIACFGITAADLLAEVLKKYTSSEVCDALFEPVFSVCGISPNPFNDTCKLVGDVVKLAAFIIEKLEYAIEVILDLLGASILIVADAIFRIAGYFFPGDVAIKEKDELSNRDNEIGRQVIHYDLVSLCEVWLPESRESILNERSDLAALIGPRDPELGEWENLGSGLFVFSPSYPITDGGNLKYEHSGVKVELYPGLPPKGGCEDFLGKLADSDQWARKGVQLTLVDVGYGYIELYSTHLYSGGEMGLGLEPIQPKKDEVRSLQVDELAKFIQRTHKPSNVAVIAGDFNVSGKDNRDAMYKILNQNDGIKFNDWYSLDIFSKIYIDKDGNPIADPGQTNVDFDKNPSRSFDSICQIYNRNNLYPDLYTYNEVELPKGSDYYCVETKTPNGDGSRYDYIFVQQPIASHTFNLDVSRIRRRAFKREEGHHGDINFMSDHLGLELTFFVSPRSS